MFHFLQLSPHTSNILLNLNIIFILKLQISIYRIYHSLHHFIQRKIRMFFKYICLYRCNLVLNQITQCNYWLFDILLIDFTKLE